MYWASSFVAKAVTAGLVSPRALRRIERRVRRRSRDGPACDSIWSDEFVRSRLITPYQSQALLQEPSGVERSENAEAHAEIDADWPLQLGPYIVLDCVARRDLGDTFRCRAASGGATWAVKRLHAAWCDSGESTVETAIERITTVIESWNALADRRVAEMKLLKLADGRVAVAARWLHGTSLAHLLRAGRRLTPGASVRVARELIAVLATADGHGLVHGDLKPSNIFVDECGRVVLADCGLRRAIPGAGLLVARRLPPDRYDYVAPEVAAGELPPDAIADIYSLGCTIYHLVTGRPPYLDGDAKCKLAAHRAGRVEPPRSLGIELGAEARLLLDTTLQPDRARRARSYNDLLSRIPAHRAGVTLRIRQELRHGCAPMAGTASYQYSSAAEGARNRRSRWLVAAAAAAAMIVALARGSGRIMPLLNLRVPPRSASRVETKYSVGRPNSRSENGVVTALWNATEDLRAAYRAAAAHDTITLRSPGPFLLDAIEIGKPITLRGADDVRPLFVGGPGAALRVAASHVRLENVHFLRVQETLTGQERHDARAMIEMFGDEVEVCRCSFEAVGDAETPIAVEWRPAAGASGQPARLTIDATLFRRVSAAVAAASESGVQLAMEHCTHLGPGPLVESASPRGRPFQTIDISLAHVTVHSAGTIAHRFPHPLDDALPLTVAARQCLLVPRDREQPVLAVRYAAQPGILMPKVSWSGTETVCPSDATLLEVERGPDAARWRAADAAAWNAYWGTHATGIVGARMGFAGPAGSSRALPASRDTSVGADASKIISLPDVTLQNLSIMIERLGAP